jgi:hypothetical protein
MKISNFNVPNTNGPLQPPLDAGPSAASDLSVIGGSAGSGGYQPSSELQQLIQQVRQQPETRAGLVAAAIQKVQTGYYLSPAGAEATASAIISNSSNS